MKGHLKLEAALRSERLVQPGSALPMEGEETTAGSAIAAYGLSSSKAHSSYVHQLRSGYPACFQIALKLAART